MTNKELAFTLVQLQDAGKVYLTEEGFDMLLNLVKEEYFVDQHEVMEDVG